MLQDLGNDFVVVAGAEFIFQGGLGRAVEDAGHGVSVVEEEQGWVNWCAGFLGLFVGWLEADEEENFGGDCVVIE